MRAVFLSDKKINQNKNDSNDDDEQNDIQDLMLRSFREENLEENGQSKANINRNFTGSKSSKK